MAVRFDAAADRLLRTANLPSGAGPWTISLWVRLASYGGGGSYGMAFYVGADNYALRTAYAGRNTSEWVLGSGSAEVSSGTTIALDTWYHMVVTRDESLTPDSEMFIDGVSTLSLSGANGGTATRFEFGAVGTTDQDNWDGRIAAIKWWDVVLTPAQIAAEMFVTLPRFANPQGFYPTVQDTAAGLLEDWSGQGRNFTAGGTLAVEDGPPISWGAPVQFGLPVIAAAAAGEAPLPVFDPDLLGKAWW